MSWVSRRITLARLLRNWTIVYAGNLVGAVSIAVMVYLAGWWQQSDGAVGVSALATAAGKTGLSFEQVFFRGILANALVCLAVWLATGGRTVVDKVFAIVFPISAFVAAGFEHSVANMYFLSIGRPAQGPRRRTGRAWRRTTRDARRVGRAQEPRRVDGRQHRSAGRCSWDSVYWFG
jgi:formate/nitrite transporter